MKFGLGAPSLIGPVGRTSRRRMWAHLLWVAVTVGICVTATAVPAQAAFPGRNGKIVFQTNRDGNGEIYTMNGDGTGRLDLTRNPAEDIQPRWSPAGTQIVFASNRTGNEEIYTMNSDGSGVARLTFTSATNRRLSWTADGRILFHSDRDGNREIYLMNGDGSDQQNLTRSPADDAYPVASPRGHRIVITSDRGGDYHLYLLKARTEETERRAESDGDHPGAVRQITTTAGVNDFGADWSPRGNELVFTRFFDSSFGSSDLFTVHADGTGLTQLTNTPGRVEFEPAWSPDGKQIVFNACSDLGTDNQHCANYTMNADGSGETDVSVTKAPLVDDFGDSFRDPMWFPFGSGAGGSAAETNGRLEIAFAANTTIGDNNVSAIGYGLQCRAPADFDAQVDFTLLDWPTANGFWAQLAGIFVNAAVGRQSDRFGEKVLATAGAEFAAPPNVLGVGSIRLVRLAGIVTAYYSSAGEWVPVISGSAPGEALLALQGLTIPDWLSGLPVLFAFDNFRLNSGALNCPTWWDDSAPDWQAVHR